MGNIFIYPHGKMARNYSRPADEFARQNWAAKGTLFPEETEQAVSDNVRHGNVGVTLGKGLFPHFLSGYVESGNPFGTGRDGQSFGLS